LVKKIKPLNAKIHIISGDRDLYQLIDDNVMVFNPKKGTSVLECIDKDYLLTNYQLTPRQICDFKILVGDPSDNIIGIKSIGIKTATNLLLKFGTLDYILENLLSISIPQKIITALSDSQVQISINRQLVCLNDNLDLNFQLKDIRYEEVN
jgi:DNA polymerase-1